MRDGSVRHVGRATRFNGQKKQKESGHSDTAATPNDRKKGKPTKKTSTLEKTQRI